VCVRGTVLSLYFRFGVESLPAQVGTNIQDPVNKSCLRRSDGAKGFLSFGPHMFIEPGSYVAGFHVKRIGPSNDNGLIVDVVVDCGATKFAEKRHSCRKLFDDLSSFVSLPFTVAGGHEDLEVRLFVEDGVTVEMEGLTIFRADELSWKAN
jgi:hypothetical protein